MLALKKSGQFKKYNILLVIFVKKLKMGNNTLADVSASVSLLSAAVSITTIQPYVSLVASLIGICAGSFTIRYYYYKHKNSKKHNGNS